jgi:8-oxo-dGTP diphosphatase
MIHKTLPVAIGLIFHDSKVLIGKRSTGHFTGYWEFPGGKIETGETSYKALTREMDEELNIRVVNATEVIHIKDKHPSVTIHLQIWHIHQFENEIIANEQQHLQWAYINQLDKIDIIPTNKPILQYIKQSFTQCDG